MPQIEMIGMPQVRLGVVSHAMQLVGNHTHFRTIQEYLYIYVTVKIALSFASCNFLTVTGRIILKLHSNMCDYLYKLMANTALLCPSLTNL